MPHYIIQFSATYIVTAAVEADNEADAIRSAEADPALFDDQFYVGPTPGTDFRIRVEVVPDLPAGATGPRMPPTPRWNESFESFPAKYLDIVDEWLVVVRARDWTASSGAMARQAAEVNGRLLWLDRCTVGDAGLTDRIKGTQERVCEVVFRR